jgi:hypothetical protein
MNNTISQQQYRILQDHETLQNGDEWSNPFCGYPDWEQDDSDYKQNRTVANAKICHCNSKLQYRRPLPIMPGYRYLVAGDVVMEGDEYNSIVNWYPSISINCPITIQDVGTYRRKLEAPKPMVDPGEGYRLLKDDEVIKEGDECWCSFFKAWETTVAAGDTPKRYNRAYRRKLEQSIINNTKPIIINDVEVIVTNMKEGFTQDVIVNINKNTWSSVDGCFVSYRQYNDVIDIVYDIRKIGFTGRIILPAL